jgi:hypothetical protein
MTMTFSGTLRITLLLSYIVHSLLAQGTNPDDWYTRYPAYPPYCATPQEMAHRQIPPLIQDSRTGQTELLHVTGVIRHGARTPWTGFLNCWEGWAQKDDVWDCNLPTIVGVPSTEWVFQREQQEGGSPGMMLFEKYYDALSNPDDNLSNELNGTCQVGQLLLQGYEQELTNGKFLRDAYFYNTKSDRLDERLNLIDVKASVHPWDATNLYFRVDDEQRTLMSGQVLLRGMMSQEIAAHIHDKKVYPVMPLRTADKSRDVLFPNSDNCPRLSEIVERFQRSSTFKAFNESEEANSIRAFQRDVLKVENMEAIDCLMTTMCTDRVLPKEINDYSPPEVRRDLRRIEDSSNSTDDDTADAGNFTDLNEVERVDNSTDDAMSAGISGDDEADQQDETGDTDSTKPPVETNHTQTNNTTENENQTSSNSNSNSNGKGFFQRLYDFDVKKDTLVFTADDAEFSKLAMAPLWSEILPNLKAAISSVEKICCPTRPRSKMAIFSAHDTTLIPLLASLNVFEGEWPPYASMMIMEVHSINLDNSKDYKVFREDHAFRLLYNGKVLTHLVRGCPEDTDLCDAGILIAAVDEMARKRSECSRQYPVPKEYSGSFSAAKAILLLALVVVASFVFGSMATFFYVTGRLPPVRSLKGRRRVSQETTGSDGIEATNGELLFREEVEGSFI